MEKEPGIFERFVGDISRLMEALPEQEEASRQSLQLLASSHPQAFCAAGIRVLSNSKPSAGRALLVQLLIQDRKLVAGLLDSRICALEEAVAAAQATGEVNSPLRTALETALTQTLQASTSAQNAARILRILELLAATGAENCWKSFEAELMAYPDKLVRSKAALLIGQGARRAAWIGRRLMDSDPRVQANAVEALWGLQGPDAHTHLMTALQSKHHRVAGNAALGLYRISDPQAVRVLTEMTRHPDLSFRLAGLWAVGQTADGRFLPALTEQFKNAQGKERLAIAAAISRIRRRQRDSAETGVLGIHNLRVLDPSSGRRRLTFALSCQGPHDLSGLTPMDFTLWKNGRLLEDYQVRPVGNPAVLIAGFTAPRFPSSDERSAAAFLEGLRRCAAMKRPDDLWRIDRYAVEAPVEEAGPVTGESILPYADAVVTPELIQWHGCIADPDQLAQAIQLTAPAERAAADLLAGLQRQGEALGKHSGKRHVFVFLHEKVDHALKQEAAVSRLTALLKDNSLVLHALAQGDAAQWKPFRDLCLSNPEGSFSETAPERLAADLVEAYAPLLNRFEIDYALPAGVQPGPVTLKVLSTQGAGQAELPLPVVEAAPEAAEPAAASPAAP